MPTRLDSSFAITLGWGFKIVTCPSLEMFHSDFPNRKSTVWSPPFLLVSKFLYLMAGTCFASATNAGRSFACAELKSPPWLFHRSVQYQWRRSSASPEASERGRYSKDTGQILGALGQASAFSEALKSSTVRHLRSISVC